jgi:hypothetical protein
MRNKEFIKLAKKKKNGEVNFVGLVNVVLKVSSLKECLIFVRITCLYSVLQKV